MLHKDLGIPAVQEVIHERSIKHRTNLESHFNQLLQLLPRDNIILKLKRRWPADLQYGQRDLLVGGDLITLVSLQVRLPASTLAYKIPNFSIDNAHLMYNAQPELFRHSF